MRPTLLVLGLLPGPFLPAQAPPSPMNITVNKADLKDVLRAATEGTDLSLIFEPGLDTQVAGLNLKAMSLDQLLDQVLPKLGLTCTREGRNLHIHKTTGGLRFYSVEQLAMARNGTKAYQVNASGQVLQTSGPGSNGAANTSAYTSSVQMGQVHDLWADLESGLQLLIFGKPLERSAPAAQANQPPVSRGYASDGKSLLIQPNPGLVGVDADPATQLKVEAYLKAVGQRTQRQVLLEARIVEITLGQDSQLGVDWNGLLGGAVNPAASSFSAGTTLNSRLDESLGVLRLVAQSGRVQATLSALARDNRLKVLSAPRLSTLNNQKAILRVVREEAYALPSSQITPGTAAGGAVATGQLTPMIVPVGIVLDIQPQIGDDGMITLAVNPSISEVVEERAFSLPNPANPLQPGATTKLPVVDRRDLDTVVRIKSGETLVLAGIIKSRESNENRGIPWLYKLPLIGNLFAKKEKSRIRTELAIFISPTLMEERHQIEAERQSAERRLDNETPGQKQGPLAGALVNR